MTNYDHVTARFGGRDHFAADAFDRATMRAQHLTTQLLQDGIPPAIVADALITQGLAAWAADTGRKTAAGELLRVWADVRDS